MKTGRTPKTCPAVLALLQADTSPIGLTHGEIMAATGLNGRQASVAIQLLRKSDRCLALGRCKDSRFFASVERVEECCAAFDAFMVALTAARKLRRRERQAEGERRYYARMKAEGCLPKRAPDPDRYAKRKAAGKVPKKPPKPLILKPSKPRKADPRKAWRDSEPVFTAETKVTICRGFDGDRWKASVPADGFVAEWAALRGKRDSTARTAE